MIENQLLWPSFSYMTLCLIAESTRISKEAREQIVAATTSNDNINIVSVCDCISNLSQSGKQVLFLRKKSSLQFTESLNSLKFSISVILDPDSLSNSENEKKM